MRQQNRKTEQKWHDRVKNAFALRLQKEARENPHFVARPNRTP